MKMKAICEITGLTRKTVLYYEKQGFVHPKITRENGRDYREYSEENVKQLQNVATLRKCRFSIDEIKGMYDQPEQVLHILKELKERLQKDQLELTELLRRMSEMSEENICDVPSLVRELEEAAEPLPLPEADLEPHFLYLDRLEADLTEKVRPSKYHADSRRVEIDQDHIIMDRRFGSKKLLDDLKEDLNDSPQCGIPEPTGGSIWLGVLKGAAIIGLVMFFFDMMLASRGGILSKWFLMDIGIMVGLVGVIVGISALQRCFGYRKR